MACYTPHLVRYRRFFRRSCKPANWEPMKLDSCWASALLFAWLRDQWPVGLRTYGSGIFSYLLFALQVLPYLRSLNWGYRRSGKYS
jgi:hypothetical protein